MRNEIGLLGLREGNDPQVLSQLTGLTDEQIRQKIDDNLRIEIIESVYSDFEKRREDRLALELQWRLTINFLAGNQMMRINTAMGDIEEAEQLSWWEERESFNQLAPILETRLAKLNKVMTKLKVRPATGETDDIANAKVSQKLLESNFKAINHEKLQRRATVWAERTGTAFWKPHWNEKKGQVIGFTEQTIDEDDIRDLPEFERKLRMTGNTRKIPIFNGDVDVTVCSSFEIYPDSIYHPGCKEARSIIHARVYDVDEVYANWDKRLKPGEFNVFSIESGKMTTGSIGVKGSQYQIMNSVRKNSVLVLEKWELPSMLYPDGRLIIVGIGNEDKQLLYYGKLPYRLGEDDDYQLPFVEQKCIDMNEFFGISPYDRLLPLQRRYNSLRNRKKEYLNRVAIGQLVFEEGSIDEEAMSEDAFGPGSMIGYLRGFNPPKYMDTPNLPHAFDSEENTLLLDFNRISGISEISKESRAPAADSSGVAISLLKEQDEIRLSITASYISEAKRELGKMFLKLNHDHVDFERQIRHVGKDEEVSIEIWNSNNITSYDVYIEDTSSLSDTPAARRQMIFELLQTGILTSGIDKKMIAKIFEVMQLGNWESFSDEVDVHVDKAKRENRLMAKNMMPEFVDYDNHELHLTKHQEFMLSGDYQELIKTNPEIAALFEHHRQQHLEVVQLRQQQIAQEQAMQQQAEQKPKLA